MGVTSENTTPSVCGGGQMAILLSLLYVGVVRCGNQKVIGTFDSLLLYGSRYVSEILAAIGLCLYGMY